MDYRKLNDSGLTAWGHDPDLWLSCVKTTHASTTQAPVRRRIVHIR